MLFNLALHLLVSTVSGCQVYSCYDHYFYGSDMTSSIKVIHPYDAMPDRAVRVWCEADHGGGWTVIQRRVDSLHQENFFRTWMEYALGFGEVENDHWLGLDHIHALTSHTLNELLIVLEDFDGITAYANYDFFYVHDRDASYQLEINSYGGTAGDSFSTANGMKFSTKDVDLDNSPQSCAERNHAGWWYSNCTDANLNGLYLKGPQTSEENGVNWKAFRGNKYSLKTATMMIRPKYKQP